PVQVSLNVPVRRSPRRTDVGEIAASGAPLAALSPGSVLVKVPGSAWEVSPSSVSAVVPVFSGFASPVPSESAGTGDVHGSAGAALGAGTGDWRSRLSTPAQTRPATSMTTPTMSAARTSHCSEIRASGLSSSGRSRQNSSHVSPPSSAGGAVKTSLSPYWLTGVLPLRQPGSSDRNGACWRGGSSLWRGGGILICSRDSSSFRGGLYGALPLARRFGVSSQLGGAKRGPGVSFPGWSAVVGPGVSSRPASAGSSAVAGSCSGSGPVPQCGGADLGAGGSGSAGGRGGGRGGGKRPRFRAGGGWREGFGDGLWS